MTKKEMIRVRFFEQGNDEPFVASQMPIDQLPETFAIDTQLDIGGQKWEVIEAQPAQKKDFGKSGELNIILTPYESTAVDPKSIRFSLPTLNDRLAALAPAASLENLWVSVEDDWRQVEFVSTAFAAEVAAEIEAIKAIVDENANAQGFESLHLRKAIEHPLAEVSLYKSDIEKFFPLQRAFAGVAFKSVAATVVNGFAWETASGLVLWGHSNAKGQVHTLNLSYTQKVEAKAVAAEIDSFLSANGLFLVDWPATHVVGDSESFADYPMV